MDNYQKNIEKLEAEIIGLKTRVRRIEELLLNFPPPEEYIIGSGEEKLFDKSAEIISQYDRASASLLQRRLSIGYAKAARLIDLLEKNRLVSPAEGAKPREVYYDKIKSYIKEKKKIDAS